MAVLQTPVFP